MNEKHYDNLCDISRIISEKVGTDGAEMSVRLWVGALLSQNDVPLVETLAGLYNALDVLCISLDCEDEVQDIADRKAAEMASRNA